ncbi:IS3-like element ISAar43 family transposase [Cutibacterium avidum]|uniref:IS3-like element ISAar43 family transposase n=1 Tax=Cutibacterium avidum TaxID=33010 RepID=UPI0012DB3AD2|nr:IS3-like element ISAar43 family transposase [Cutibacterium avidum]QQY14194.1 IS3-like element ISAar43 family transposase [Cutibacterium avidum]QQY14445.1 IS3-like element ISAar43 family transposase [Cutibacterium avidum]QQY14708.1 IS3-like element ISAar43 family transposase [Cutibacterium avidum]QQY14782.1 IS3-like element ISAar43 family transposase [Cutibacterium avidum]QQY14871.1 IS3-like element ISAar43 family transposase [Cutibacterium avidum]
MTNSRKRHTPEQVVRKLGQADRMLAGGSDIAGVCRELGVSEQTYYRWRNQYGGLKADDAKRLKELEKQNATLKRLLAEAELEKAALRELAGGKLLGPGRRRAAVDHLKRKLRVSERMACRLAGLSRSAYRRPLQGETTADPDLALRDWLRAYAKKHPRWGYRRAYHDARGEGWVVNHKKIQRLWREEGLRVPQRRRRKRVGSSTVDAPAAVAPNLVWAVDFQFDADEQGRPIKICSIVDEHTRECIGGLVERSITADRLTAHLEDLVAVRGAPAVLRSDNGPEFISDAMADWAGTRTGLFYIPPGSPWHNGYVESFNSRLRDECLNINSFYSLLHAQVVIGDWKTEYNHDRRHSSLGYLAPVDYARQCTHQSETDDSHSDRTE